MPKWKHYNYIKEKKGGKRPSETSRRVIYITDVKEVRTLNAAASGGKKFRGFILKKYISGLFDVAKRLRSSLRLICTTATPYLLGIDELVEEF